jgi:hypothetical protein
MRSRKSETIAGFCRQCQSEVQLVNRIYSCQCGRTADESYDFPPSWVFKLSQVAKPPIYNMAKVASGQIC